MILQYHFDRYKNNKDVHKWLVDDFTILTNEIPYLREHRDFVEQHVYGFGERAFHYLWYLLVLSLDSTFKFLEIGVYKGQVLSLIKLISLHLDKEAFIYGVTRLDSFAGETGIFPDHPKENYRQHILDLYQHFGLEFDDSQLIVGDSTNEEIIAKAKMIGPYDIVYVDGCHEYKYVKLDLEYYGEMVKIGGYLVVDDSSNNLDMPYGYFTGIQDVSNAVRDIIEPSLQWEHKLAIMHLRVFKRI